MFAPRVPRHVHHRHRVGPEGVLGGRRKQLVAGRLVAGPFRPRAGEQAPQAEAQAQAEGEDEQRDRGRAREARGSGA